MSCESRNGSLNCIGKKQNGSGPVGLLAQSHTREPSLVKIEMEIWKPVISKLVKFYKGTFVVSFLFGQKLTQHPDRKRRESV